MSLPRDLSSGSFCTESSSATNKLSCCPVLQTGSQAWVPFTLPTPGTRLVDRPCNLTCFPRSRSPITRLCMAALVEQLTTRLSPTRRCLARERLWYSMCLKLIRLICRTNWVRHWQAPATSQGWLRGRHPPQCLLFRASVLSLYLPAQGKGFQIDWLGLPWSSRGMLENYISL